MKSPNIEAILARYRESSVKIEGEADKAKRKREVLDSMRELVAHDREREVPIEEIVKLIRVAVDPEDLGITDAIIREAIAEWEGKGKKGKKAGAVKKKTAPEKKALPEKKPAAPPVLPPATEPVKTGGLFGR